jgi:hypothetical protein
VAQFELCTNTCSPPPPWRNSPPVGQGLLIIQASRSHSDPPHLVGLFWKNDRPVDYISTWQHATLTTDRHPYTQRDSNPQSQHESGRRPRDHWDRQLLVLGLCKPQRFCDSLFRATNAYMCVWGI